MMTELTEHARVMESYFSSSQTEDVEGLVGDGWVDLGFGLEVVCIFCVWGVFCDTLGLVGVFSS